MNFDIIKYTRKYTKNIKYILIPTRINLINTSTYTIHEIDVKVISLQMFTLTFLCIRL